MPLLVKVSMKLIQTSQLSSDWFMDPIKLWFIAEMIRNGKNHACFINVVVLYPGNFKI